MAPAHPTRALAGAVWEVTRLAYRWTTRVRMMKSGPQPTRGSMIVTIHQPEHLPWLGFFDKMRQADVFVLLDTTQFAKDDYQNRNRIKTAQGATLLTVPVYKHGRSLQLIRDVEICNDTNWRGRCWNQISQSYRTAPYFAEHRPFFHDLYSRPWTKLCELNSTIIRYLAACLGLTTTLLTASELGVFERGGTNVNLAICRALGASAYLSGKHGRQYLDEDRFVEHGIRVTYQDFQHPLYPQQWGAFVSHLSIIDLLFNCGEASLRIIAEAQGSTPLVATEVERAP